jgi:nicotinamide mononucleotide transporter
MYGAVTFSNGALALGSLNLFVIPVLLAFSNITWKNHKSKGDYKLETRKLNKQDGTIVIAAVIMLTAMLGTILVYADPTSSPDNWLSWVDGLMASIGLFAFVLSILRYRETWYLFMMSNVVKIIVWTLLIVGVGQSAEVTADNLASNVQLLTLAVIYLLNSIYGMIIWKHGKEEPLSDIRKIR